ncbi:MAG: hypothetical protein R2734_17385 [Nocardioides sp.]
MRLRQVRRRVDEVDAGPTGETAVIALRVDDQHRITGIDPALGHEPGQVALARPGVPGDEHAPCEAGRVTGPPSSYQPIEIRRRGGQNR